MILGIGVDLVNMQKFDGLIKQRSFLERTFTSKERNLAEGYSPSRKSEFYAGRFSVKEAVSKALSSFVEKDTFDLRKIETLSNTHGAPVVSIISPLAEVLKKHGEPTIHVTISHDGNYVTSVVIIERV